MISQIAANGNKIILINPIFQEGTSLNSLTINPEKIRKPKLYIDMPSIPVLINGNKGESECFKSSRKKTGKTIELIPNIAIVTIEIILFVFIDFKMFF